MPRLGRGGGIQPPNLGPGPLQLPGQPSQTPGLLGPFPPPLDFSKLTIQPPALNLTGPPQKFPGLRVPMPGPLPVVPPRLQLALPPPAPPPTPLLLNVHHFEVEAGATLNPGKARREFLFVRCAGRRAARRRRGRPPGVRVRHRGQYPFGRRERRLEHGLVRSDNRRGSIWNAGSLPFLAAFCPARRREHLKELPPVIKGGLFPANVGFDINKNVSVTASAGVAFTYDPDVGRVTAGIEGSAGLVLKFDVPVRR